MYSICYIYKWRVNRMKYYSYKAIDSKKAQYNLVIGERSNGKTYGALLKILTAHVTQGKQGAIIRRWQDDFTGKRGANMFDALVDNAEVTKLTGGLWTGVYYYGSRWYLCRYEDSKRITEENPFCYGFSLSAMEHDKSVSYPLITVILFDEFITRSMYLPDEFILFQNVLSTIIRHRTDVTIYMCGNTVNKYCPYFKEMGLTHVKDMQQGKIDVYTYGDSGLKVAVEYCSPTKHGKGSDVYFSFDNPKIKNQITRGAWEIDIYPHCPMHYIPRDIVFTYFIKFDGSILQCEVISKNGTAFTFIHPKTTPLKDEEHDLIYDTDYHAEPNYRRRLTHPQLPVEQKLYKFFTADKVFYSDNETGEIVRNYLNWSASA